MSDAVTVDTLSIEIEASSDEAASKIRSLSAALNSLRTSTKQRFENPLKSFSTKSSKSQVVNAAKISRELAAIDKQIKARENELNSLQNRLESLEFSRSITKSAGSMFNGELETVRAQIQEVSKIYDGLDAQRRTLLASLDDGADGLNGAVSSIASQASNAAESIEKASDSATEAVKRQEEAFARLKDRIAEIVDSSSSKLANLVKRVAIYRVIRSAINSVVSGFREGLENAYRFSDAINGSLANSMDRLSTSSLTMRNALGSAFGSLLQTAEPVLMRLIGLATDAADALAQLFAALGGRATYLKAAAAPTKAYAGAISSVGSAAKEALRYLAPFDELNTLPSSTMSGGGAGGGGGGGADLSKMFEVSKLSGWAQWVQDHLGLIKDLALAIGAALLTWGLASKFTDDLSKVLGLSMAVGGAVLAVKGGLDAWNNGVDWQNLTEMLAGTALMATGLGIAFGTVGAGIGALIGGISLLVVGLHDWITTGELSTQTFWMLEGGILAVGVGLSLLTGSWIPLLVSGVVAAVGLIIKHWDSVVKFIQESNSPIAVAIRGIIDIATNLWNMIFGAVQGIIQVFQGLIQFIGGVFSGNWRDAIMGLVNIFSGAFSTIASVVKGVFNVAIGVVESFLNNVISSINFLLGGVNAIASIFGINANLQIGTVSLPRLATGGFVDPGQVFIANEKGPELVGQMGTHTAVANQMQITEGITEGVQEGNEGVIAVLYQILNVAQAIREESGTGKGFDMDSLARLVTKYQARQARAAGA